MIWLNRGPLGYTVPDPTNNTNVNVLSWNRYYQYDDSTEDCCSDPSYESDPSNEYSPLGLTHVMNSIFLDPSNEFLTQAVNIGIPK